MLRPVCGPHRPRGMPLPKNAGPPFVRFLSGHSRNITGCIPDNTHSFRLFRLFRSSLCETKLKRTRKRGTVQLARTRDPPRAKRAYYVPSAPEFRTFIEHGTQLIGVATRLCRRASPSKALPSCLSSGLGPTYKRLRRLCGGSPPSSRGTAAARHRRRRLT